MIKKSFNKSNIFKLISLIFLLYSNQILISSELNQRKTKNIYTKLDSKLASNSEEKIESIISIGFGTSLEKASQNAATNALTQVVGSFIDAETIIKKQTNIQNGIVEQTSIIREDINEYSQGTIKYFEILNINQNGSLYEVTARVDVKIEDFRVYIKELASGIAKIEKNQVINYFAKAAAELENKSNILAIIKKIYQPLYSGEVFKIYVDKSEFQTLSNWQSNSNYCKNNNSNSCNPNGLYKKWDKNRTFIIPFSISLREDYKTNLFNKLNNISSKKIVQHNIRQYPPQDGRRYDFKDFYMNKFNSENDYNISIIDPEKNKKFIYIIKDALLTYKKEIAKQRGVDFINFEHSFIKNKYFYVPGGDPRGGYCGKSNAFYNLQFNLKNKDDNILKSTIIYPSCNQYYSYPFSIWLKPSMLRYSTNNNYGNLDAYEPLFSLLNSDEGTRNRVDRVIFTKKEYYFVMEIDLEILPQLEEIEIRFIEN